MALLFMVYTVYVLYSESSGKHYAGFTSDIENRMLSHNKLGKDWTRSYRPWKVIYTREFSLKEEAMTHERWLKTGVGREFIKTLPH
jgi:putative endonuclease